MLLDIISYSTYMRQKAITEDETAKKKRTEWKQKPYIDGVVLPGEGHRMGAQQLLSCCLPPDAGAPSFLMVFLLSLETLVDGGW